MCWYLHSVSGAMRTRRRVQTSKVLSLAIDSEKPSIDRCNCLGSRLKMGTFYKFDRSRRTTDEHKMCNRNGK